MTVKGGANPLVRAALRYKVRLYLSCAAGRVSRGTEAASRNQTAANHQIFPQLLVSASRI